MTNPADRSPGSSRLSRRRLLRGTALLAGAFETIRERHEQKGLSLPQNKGKRRDLDCMVIDELVVSAAALAGHGELVIRLPHQAHAGVSESHDVHR